MEFFFFFFNFNFFNNHSVFLYKKIDSHPSRINNASFYPLPYLPEIERKEGIVLGEGEKKTIVKKKRCHVFLVEFSHILRTFHSSNIDPDICYNLDLLISAQNINIDIKILCFLKLHLHIAHEMVAISEKLKPSKGVTYTKKTMYSFNGCIY